MVQWLRRHTPKAGGLASIPGQGSINRLHKLRLESPHGSMKTLHAKTKTRRSQTGEEMLSFRGVHVLQLRYSVLTRINGIQKDGTCGHIPPLRRGWNKRRSSLETHTLPRVKQTAGGMCCMMQGAQPRAL